MAFKKFNRWRTAGLAFVLGAALMAWSTQDAQRVNADTRRPTPDAADQHFKSGGRLAESVLQEILVVLKRMDDRLANLEASAKSNARGGPNLMPPASDSERG